MKRIFLLILFCSITVNLSAQIISDSIQGIDCHNDTGFIALNVITLPSTLPQWEYQKDTIINLIDSFSWEPSYSFSFIYLSSLQDTLKTTQCGKYRSIVTYLNPSFAIDTNTFSIPCPVTIGQGQDNILCYGDSSGALRRPTFGGKKIDPDSSIATSDLLTGDEYYIYTWFYADDSLGTNSISLSDTAWALDSLSSGWYKTIVRDDIGCTDSIDYSPFCINFPALIRVDTLIVDHNKCIGDTTASIFITVQGGIKYNINNQYFYYLILNTDTVASSDLTGNTGYFTHLAISNTTQNSFLDSIAFNNLAAGSYIFSVVDSNACVMQDTIEILEPDAYIIYPSASLPLPLCNTDTGEFLIDSITGDNPPFEYYFLGFGTDTINVPAGTYDILVEDSIGCIDTLSATWIPQYEIKDSTTIYPILCFGDSSGVITIDSIYGGNAPYTIQWNNGDTTKTIVGLAPEIYTVSIIDSLGCTLDQDFTMEQLDSLSANAIFYLPSCNGSLDGSIKLNLTGGTGPYNYLWNSSPTANDSISNLPGGTYSCIITDANGCMDTISLTLDEPSQVAFIFANYNNPLPCIGEITTVDILISGGTGPFNVLWNDSVTDIQRILSAGSYSCVVTDTNGCATPNNPIIISEPDFFSIQDVFDNNATCDSGGSAIVIIVGGTDPIQYKWYLDEEELTGETSQSIDSLWGANYSVTATDSCGNSDTAYFDLIPSNFIMVLLYDSVTHIASIEIDSSSSGGPFSYLWTNILGDTISTDSVFKPCQRKYIGTTTDNTSNCSITDTLDVVFYLPNGIYDAANTMVFDNEDLWGGPLPYTYFWSTGEETQLSTKVCPGLNFVEVTDDNGCMIDTVFYIDPIEITLAPAEAIIKCNRENLDVELKVIPDGGTAPYTYQWSSGSTENPLNIVLHPGNFSVTVMDNNACTKDTAFIIATISAECVPNVFSPNGDNINDIWSLEETFLYSDSEVRIYGRYGKLLFKSIGYTSPWDGKNKKGNDVPDGVYFYSIEIGHDYGAIKGSVAIIR